MGFDYYVLTSVNAWYWFAPSSSVDNKHSQLLQDVKSDVPPPVESKISAPVLLTFPTEEERKTLTPAFITLDGRDGYYWQYVHKYDPDDPILETQASALEEQEMEAACNAPPFVLFSRGQWISDKVRQKYETLLFKGLQEDMDSVDDKRSIQNAVLVYAEKNKYAKRRY